MRFPKQELPHRVERALPSLLGAQRRPRAILRRHIEQGQDRRERRLESRVTLEDVVCHLRPYLLAVGAIRDLEVPLEEIDHWQVAHRLPVGERVPLEDSPTLELRLDELVHQTRLANARLTDDRHDLAVAGPGQPASALQLLQLHVATDEP